VWAHFAAIATPTTNETPEWQHSHVHSNANTSDPPGLAPKRKQGRDASISNEKIKSIDDLSYLKH